MFICRVLKKSVKRKKKEEKEEEEENEIEQHITEMPTYPYLV